MKTLKDIPFLQGVKVLVRVDFNVPIKNGRVMDDFRIKSAFPTIDYLMSKGARVILIGHLEVKDEEENTFEPISRCLNKLDRKVNFVTNLRNALSEIEKMKDGECILLENLRTNEGEKKNDPTFAKALASLADIFVNDAFSVSHREHASIIGVPKYLPSYAGFQLEKEIIHLSKAFNPSHPFLFILGGAKFETKLPLLEKFIEIADDVFVGGALANDFNKVRGYETGISLVSKEDFDLKRFINNKKLILPVDITNQDGEVKSVDKLIVSDNAVDCGPKTLELLKEKIANARLILWNGPLGIYEQGFKTSTLKLAEMIANLNKGETLVGGGDTIAAIAQNGDEAKFTFASTGGGAMLDFLAKGTLVGIEALED